MKLTYQRKLTLSFLLIFVLFTAGIIVFQQSEARRYRTEALEERLESYSDLIYQYVKHNDIAGKDGFDDLLAILPSELRLTVIGADGGVRFDNLFPEPASLGDHSGRPEVLKARAEGDGYDIRTSASNNIPYIYYAKYYGNEYVRVALPYDVKVKHFLQPDNAFLYFVLALLVVGLLLINYVGSRFGRSVKRLNDFASAVSSGDMAVEMPHFPHDELGEIGEKIARGYKHLQEDEEILSREREKLLQHVQSSAEGVCFFNPDGTVAFYNGLFIQYMNTISDAMISGNPALLSLDVFDPVRNFLKERGDEVYFETRVIRMGREFLLRVNVFDDGSVETVFNDITRQERTRKLKQEMTGNIAHELRTPVTSIRGYLETVLDLQLPHDKEREFIRKAYNQTIALSELIRDMSMLTKIEETPEKFRQGEVRLGDIVERVKAELAPELDGQNITVESELPADLVVKGNDSLIYSVFRNLTDNVIHHAGEGVRIIISEAAERNGFAYISFADTGRGVGDDVHLNRIFERFYRTDEGRTRDAGGSGLGLSIVKNIVSLHGGTITAKNRSGGGLEFLFSLPVYK